MKPKDRLTTVAVNLASAVKAQTFEPGGEKPTRTLAEADAVREILDLWPAASRKAAEEIGAKYGLPNEAVPSRLIWYDNRPWKRTVVYRDEIPHNFPQPHADVLEQVIDYQVPLDRVAQVLAFDGSLVIERTAGEVGARCDMEAANVASLNLMHDIVMGRLDVEAARKEMAEVASAYLLNREVPYATGFQFELPQGGARDADHTVIGPALVKQGLGKLKDLVRPGEHDHEGD